MFEAWLLLLSRHCIRKSHRWENIQRGGDWIFKLTPLRDRTGAQQQSCVWWWRNQHNLCAGFGKGHASCGKLGLTCERGSNFWQWWEFNNFNRQAQMVKIVLQGTGNTPIELSKSLKLPEIIPFTTPPNLNALPLPYSYGNVMHPLSHLWPEEA